MKALTEGLTFVEAPALPSGYLIRCIFCGCSVDFDHVPGDDFCQDLQDERAAKAADDE